MGIITIIEHPDFCYESPGVKFNIQPEKTGARMTQMASCETHVMVKYYFIVFALTVGE